MGDGAEGAISFLLSTLPSFHFLQQIWGEGIKSLLSQMVFQAVDDVRLTCPVNFWILLLPHVQTHQGLQLTWDGLLSLEICPSSPSGLHCPLTSPYMIFTLSRFLLALLGSSGLLHPKRKQDCLEWQPVVMNTKDIPCKAGCPGPELLGGSLALRLVSPPCELEGRRMRWLMFEGCFECVAMLCGPHSLIYLPFTISGPSNSQPPKSTCLGVFSGPQSPPCLCSVNWNVMELMSLKINT